MTEGVTKFSYDFSGMLEKLTGQTGWEEVDGPESGIGLEYYYHSGSRQAYIHIDQADLDISIGDIGAEADEHYSFNNGSLEKPPSEEIEEFIDYYEMTEYHVQISRRISAYTPEGAARKFAETLDENKSREFMIDVFESDITQGLASDERAGLFDPSADFELIQ